MGDVMRRLGWLAAAALLGLVAGATLPACADDDYGTGPDLAQQRDLSATETGTDGGSAGTTDLAAGD
jgi:hypothetical protein